MNFNWIKKITPPIFIDFIRYFKSNNKQNIHWSGDYISWQEVMKHCDGYDNEHILNQCKNSLLKVKNGEAVYERDSVLFDELLYSFPLLALLQRVALENEGHLCVLDFGGSLGSSYFQNKDFLSSLQGIKWCIIEQSNFVECGKEYFEDKQLCFYNTIEDCLKQHKPNILLVSGVLQYLQEPEQWINKFLQLNLPYIVIDRTTFVENNRTLLTVQNVPPQIYQASYPCWFFNFEIFMIDFLKKYSILAVFDSFADSPILLNGNKKASWKGILLKRK